jgi:hypothetical protein
MILYNWYRTHPPKRETNMSYCYCGIANCQFRTEKCFHSFDAMENDYVPLDVKEEDFDRLLYESGSINFNHHDSLAVRDYALSFYKKHIMYNNRLIRHLTDDCLSKLFRGISLCSCCWRHCHNRPESDTSSESRSILNTVTQEMITQSPECHCPCRHFMRCINEERRRRYVGN